jgi:hypothetical protein
MPSFAEAILSANCAVCMATVVTWQGVGLGISAWMLPGAILSGVYFVAVVLETRAAMHNPVPCTRHEFVTVVCQALVMECVLCPIATLWWLWFDLQTPFAFAAEAAVRIVLCITVAAVCARIPIPPPPPEAPDPQPPIHDWPADGGCTRCK